MTPTWTCTQACRIGPAVAAAGLVAIPHAQLPFLSRVVAVWAFPSTALVRMPVLLARGRAVDGTARSAVC